MRRHVALLVSAAALAAGCGGAEQPRDRTDRAVPGPRAGALDAAAITVHLRALQRIADRNDGNRAAGTRGDTETADYIAARLRAAGWRVRFQTVRFPFFKQRGRPVVGGLRRGRDFSVLEYSPGGDVTARVQPRDTRACTQDELEPFPRGQIALVARGTCTFRRKATNAQRAGAAALLVVDAGARRPASGTLGRPNGIDIPVVSITGAAAARLARGVRPVRVRVDTVSEQRATRNVIADSGAADAVAMAGAHLDSVEEGPGINDDGSGVAALLAVAERERRPGLRLGFWAAEELGLYGSRRYVRALSGAERRRIAAYVNLDMVGSPKPRRLVYDTDNRAERLLRAALPGKEGEVSLGASSDHAPFQRAGIAVGGLFTGASAKTDPCYHRPCDTVRSADPEIAALMARAAQQALGGLRP